MARIMLIEPATETKEGVMRILASIGTNKVNWKFPPLDILGVAGTLRKNGINDFSLLDALNLELTHAQTKDYIKKEAPECIVFTFTVYTIKNDMKVATIAKEIGPDIKTIAINFAAESYEGDILKDFPDLDFLAYHEPEYPVLDLIKSNYRPDNVAGIYYRDNGSIKKNPERMLENLDDIGIMPHDMLPISIYKSPFQKRKPMSATAFTRGCINMCSHCIGSRYLSLYPGRHPKGGHVRFRSYGSILEELRLLNSLGIKELRFFDGELTADMDWADGLFDVMIKEKTDITFSCNLRADTINDTLLGKMKKAGCHLVSIGIDSVNQKILDNMRKNLTMAQIQESVKLIKKHNFRMSTFTTFGHEGETRETMLETIRYIKKVNPDICSFSLAVPVRGTMFYDYLMKNNFLDKSADLQRYDPNLPPVYSYPHLSASEMYEIAMYGYRYFYFRPKYVIKRLFRSYHRLDDLKYMFYCIHRYIFEPFFMKDKHRC